MNRCTETISRLSTSLEALGLLRSKGDAIKHLFGVTSPNKDICYELKNGVRIFVPGSHRYRTILLTLHEIFAREIYPVTPRDGNIVIDAGAQVGAFSLYAAVMNPRAVIHAYEPDPENFRYLVKNGVENGVAARLCAFEKCIGPRHETVEFRIHARSSRAGGLYSPSGKQISVEAVTLEDIFFHASDSRVHILKVDIEGAEYDTFYSAPPDLFGCVDNIFMECHRRQATGASYTIDSMKDFLQSKGFSVNIRRKDNMLLATRQKSDGA